MELRRIHHVAVAHPADSPLPSALARHCGLHVGHEEEAEGFVERMWPVGDGFVQSLESTGEGIIERSLASRGPGLHHIAFEVDDIDAALAELSNDGAKLIDEVARPGGAGTRIAFIHPSVFGGMLVEFVEEPNTTNPTHS